MGRQALAPCPSGPFLWVPVAWGGGNVVTLGESRAHSGSQVQVEILGQKPLLGSKGNFRPPCSVARMSCGIWDVLSPSFPSSEVAAKIPDPGVRQASPLGQVKSRKNPLPFYLPPASLPHSCPLQFILCTAARALAKPKPVIPLLGALQWLRITLRTKCQLPQPLSPWLTRLCLIWPLHDLSPFPLAPSAQPHQPSCHPKHAKPHIPVSGPLHVLFLCTELSCPTSLPSPHPSGLRSMSPHSLLTHLSSSLPNSQLILHYITRFSFPSLK